MLSTRQALKEWDSILKVLVDFKTHAAAHPDQLPKSLIVRWESSTQALYMDLASPLTTWEQLLKRKVPRLVLAACCKLMGTDSSVVLAYPGHCVAALMVDRAVTTLLPLAAGTTSSSSSSSSSRLTAMFWEQLVQSGLLQQLPDAVGLEASRIDMPLSQQQTLLSDGTMCTVQIDSTCPNVLTLLHIFNGLKQLQPAFLTHAAGQQCAVPAMQLALVSLQHISKAVAVGEQQEFMGPWLGQAWNAAVSGTAAAVDIVSSREQPGGRSGSLQGAALDVLQAEPTQQCYCLGAVVPMLVQFLHAAQQATATAADKSSGSTTSSSRSSCSREAGRNSHPANTASSSSSSGAASSSRQHSQQAAGSRSVSGQQWLPAALAPSMPAAYSSVLEQLGCSREVGLWMAMELQPADVHKLALPGVGAASLELPNWNSGTVLTGLKLVTVLLAALRQHGLNFQTAALPVSLSASSLQWLSSMPHGTMLRCLDDCEYVCRFASNACERGQVLMQQPGQQLGQQQVEQCIAANQAVAQLSAAVLDKLLGLYRGLPGSREASTGVDSSSSSNSIDGNSSNEGVLNTACYLLVAVLEGAMTAATAAVEPDCCSAATILDQQSAPGHVLQLVAQSCKVLQDYVRTIVAAAPRPPPPAAAMCSSMPVQDVVEAASLTEMMHGPHHVATLLGALHRRSSDSLSPVDSLDSLDSLDSPSGPSVLSTGGALVAPFAAAGDVSSPAALQLFGLLASLLKVYSNSFPTAAIPQPEVAPVVAAGSTATRSCSLGPYQDVVGTAVFAAVSTMVETASGGASPGVNQGSNSTNSTSSGSTCAAALPWLVLLSRCCYACAVLAQHWQGILGADSESDEDTLDNPWLEEWLFGAEAGLYRNLLQLHSSLAGMVQWLADSSTAQQLTALGYMPQDLQQQLQAASGALRSLADNMRVADDPQTGWHSATAAAVLRDIREQLQAAGRVLACFAIPNACNNPACSNLTGPSEAQLVGGRSCICGGCRTALLWQGLPACGMAPAQARVQSAGCSSGGSSSSSAR